MKVGTDGVLLGAWSPTAISHQHSAFSILDVGTGSGLVALMMAQRCLEAQIDAIDIDEEAVKQAKENIDASPWRARLHAYCRSLQDWEPSTQYDLIVSNPPYFQNSLKNPDKGRELARHTDSLSYEELIAHSARLLAPNGLLALILPAEAEQEIRQLAQRYSLYCTHVTRVYSKESKPARRVLIAFKYQHSAISIQPSEDTLVLEDDKGGRSAAYQELTKDFYL
jgi:tRNA1Val (adenine37-N6)-methyltransferase